MALQVNVRDERGYSPLMYAAYSEAMPAGIVRTLLAKGADTSITGEGETALSLASKRGDNEVARLLGVPELQRKSGGVASVESHPKGSRPVAEAVRMALSQVEKQSPTFLKRSGCNSCHNQYLPSAAMVLARERGLTVPRSVAEVSLEMREVSPERVMDLDTFGVTSLGYEMFRNAAVGQPADEYTDAVVHFIKVMQTPAGDWENTGNRPPLTYDRFITAALAINTLRTYGPAAQQADTEKRLARAAAWLESAKPVTTQERAFHLLGLSWAKGSPTAIERAAQGLAQTQRPTAAGHNSPQWAAMLTPPVRRCMPCTWPGRCPRPTRCTKRVFSTCARHKPPTVPGTLRLGLSPSSLTLKAASPTATISGSRLREPVGPPWLSRSRSNRRK